MTPRQRERRAKRFWVDAKGRRCPVRTPHASVREVTHVPRRPSCRFCNDTGEEYVCDDVRGSYEPCHGVVHATRTIWHSVRELQRLVAA